MLLPPLRGALLETLERHMAPAQPCAAHHQESMNPINLVVQVHYGWRLVKDIHARGLQWTVTGGVCH